MAMDAVRLDFVGTSAQNFNILLVAPKSFLLFSFNFQYYWNQDVYVQMTILEHLFRVKNCNGDFIQCSLACVRRTFFAQNSFYIGVCSCMLMVLVADEGMQKDLKRKTFILWNIFQIFCSDTSNCEIESKLSKVG